MLELGKLAEARTVAMFHHEPERNDDALDQIAVHCEEWARERAKAMRTIVARERVTLDLLKG